jgi:hypothetical protein
MFSIIGSQTSTNHNEQKKAKETHIVPELKRVKYVPPGLTFKSPTFCP